MDKKKYSQKPPIKTGLHVKSALPALKWTWSRGPWDHVVKEPHRPLEQDHAGEADLTWSLFSKVGF